MNNMKKLVSVVVFSLATLTMVGCETSPITPSTNGNSYSCVFSQKINDSGDSTQLTIYRDRALIEAFTFWGSLSGEIIHQTADVLYIGGRLGGMGGYITYGHYTQIWKYNTESRSIEDLLENQLTDADFDPELESIVYANGNSIIVKDLSDMSKQVFTPNWGLDQAGQSSQVGDFKFSPDGKQVAIAVTWGPENEHGAIYTLNIATQEFQLVKEFSGKASISKWGSY